MIEQKSAPRSAAWPLGAGLMLLGLACAAHAQFYAVTDLGTLGGTNAMAYGINNREQIVGAAQTGTNHYHAFMFEGGRMMGLGTLGGSNSWAYGINDHGWMVGASELGTTNVLGFLCTNAALGAPMMNLGTLGGSNSAAWMINLHGEIVGWAAVTNGSHHAFFLTNHLLGGMMDLGIAGGTYSEAYCVNSNRVLVGYAMMSNGTETPLLFTNALSGSSSMMMMGMGGMDALGGWPWFVNELGNTVGQAQMAGGVYHAYVTRTSGMMGWMNVDLGTLGGSNSLAYCLNNRGAVIGTAQTASGMPHAFLVTNALTSMVGMMDLNDLIPTNCGWVLMEARSINDAGQIVGWGMHAGHTNAFLLTPVSAPVMMVSAPAGQVVGPGTPVSLQTQMSASEPLRYQWLHNGMAIPGATNATLMLPGMGTAAAGWYTVTARNAVGTVANASALVGMFSLSFTNRTAHLALTAATGSRFRVDYSDGLGSGAHWQVMTNLTLMDPTSQISDTPPQDSRARFYRAAMLP